MIGINEFKRYIYKVESKITKLNEYTSDINFNSLKTTYANDVYNFNKQLKIVNIIKNLINDIENTKNNLCDINIILKNDISKNDTNIINTYIFNNIEINTLYPDNIYNSIFTMYNSYLFEVKWECLYTKDKLIENIDNIKKILIDEDNKLNEYANKLRESLASYIKVNNYKNLLKDFIDSL